MCMLQGKTSENVQKQLEEEKNEEAAKKQEAQKAMEARIKEKEESKNKIEGGKPDPNSQTKQSKGGKVK